LLRQPSGSRWLKYSVERFLSEHCRLMGMVNDGNAEVRNTRKV
jgi:hypothetical protein